MARKHLKKPVHPDHIVDPKSVAYALPKYRGNLPHIYKDGCSYFVTFCLFDVAIPKIDLQDHRSSFNLSRKKMGGFEPPTSGSCLLKQRALAEAVQDALLHFQGNRYALSAWCVMPNHVHAVVTPYGDHHLLKVLHSWKSFTAHKINKALERTGPVWQDESFDHLIRNLESFEKFISYTEYNPVAAGLVQKPESWPFSSARFRAK